MSNGWIGVDLDGTLCEYESWISEDHLGKPIPKMVERVKKWLANEVEVKIFTARVSHPSQTPLARKTIEEFTVKQFGQKLEVTNVKDYAMIELWDDRAIQVESNTGKRMDGIED